MSPTDITTLVAGQKRLEELVTAESKARAEDAVRATAKLTEITVQVQATNGRVSRLEAWKDRVLGGTAALGFAYAVATDLFGLLAK